MGTCVVAGCLLSTLLTPNTHSCTHHSHTDFPVLFPAPVAVVCHHHPHHHPQEYLLTPPDQLMQVLMGVIKAHMAAEPDTYKVTDAPTATGGHT